MSSRLRKQLIAERRGKKRQRFFRKLFFIFIIVLVVVGSGLLYGFSEKFRIQRIGIAGLERTPEADVRELIDVWLLKKRFFLLPHDVLWALPAGELKTFLITSFPTIKEVDIRKNFPNGLELYLTEYDAWGVLCRPPAGGSEECFWINRGGVAFERAPEFSGVIVPKIRDERSRDVRLGEEQLSQDMMHLIAFFNEKAVDDKNLQSLQFMIDSKDSTLRVKTRGGWDILLLESNDPAAAYKNLRTALEGEIKEKISKLEYIDLRFSNRVFYKFKE